MAYKRSKTNFFENE
jgi:hypothetical protein